MLMFICTSNSDNFEININEIIRGTRIILELSKFLTLLSSAYQIFYRKSSELSTQLGSTIYTFNYIQTEEWIDVQSALKLDFVRISDVQPFRCSKDNRCYLQALYKTFSNQISTKVIMITLSMPPLTIIDNQCKCSVITHAQFML